MNRLLPILSLMISIAALAVALSGRSTAAKPDPELIRRIVDGELQRRETELVTSMAPKFRALYKDMLGPDEKLDERALNPTTFADLMRPLVTIIGKMQGSDEPPKK